MKKFSLVAILIIASFLVTGCGCGKKSTTKKPVDANKTVVEDQVFEGLEFVNLSAKDGAIKTILINNTGYTYEGSKFRMIVKDENGNTIADETDEVKEKVETGTTREIVTKTNADLSKAASIEYSIVNE